MTHSPTRRAAAAAVAAALFAAAAAGQEPAELPPIGPFPADGTELFRGLFVVEGVYPVKSVADAEAIDPRGLILVLNGKPLADHRLAVLADRLYQAGGAVLILAEEAANLSRFAPAANLEDLAVTGKKVYCTDPSRCLDGNGWLPYPEPYIGKGGITQEAALVDGLTRIATNVPSNLRLRRRFGVGPAEVRGLAIYPERTCRAGGPTGPDLERRLLSDQGGGPGSGPPSGVSEDDRLFAAAASGPRESNGKFLVVADPSVFVNEMLTLGAAGGVDNLTFALRVVRWLKTTDGGVRGRCLFVDNGAVLGSFAEAGFSPRPIPPPPPVPVLDPLSPKFQAALADAGDRAAARVADTGWFNKLLGAGGDDKRFAGTLRATIGLLAAGGLWLVAVRARAARHAADTPPPASGSGTATAVGSLAKRQADLLKAGDVAGPVREVVAGLFMTQGMTAGSVPRIEATGPDADGLARRVRAVWDMVLGPAAVPITPGRWKELEPMLDEVYRAADAGRWRVVPDGGAA